MKHKNWREAVISPATDILGAIKIIDTASLQIALVVNDAGRLVGTITDGDVRRAILRGVPLQSPASSIMNPQPTTARQGEEREAILALMKRKQLHHIPLVDEDGVLAGIEWVDELLQALEHPNPVVLMAGGLGSRLQPLTNDCPKPLLKVGNKPILETILDNFIEHGFRRFYVSVNYKAHMVEEHFGDGSQWGVQIEYLREDRRLGTAGALALLPERPTRPFLVMNGDLLTKVNFERLLDFHVQHGAGATMCVREYDFQVPYGVVTVEKHRILGIEEKPIQRFFVNAGIYVLEPHALDHIPPNVPFDMPALFEALMKQGHETVVFPLREYWLDIGQMNDFERANGEFREVFG